MSKIKNIYNRKYIGLFVTGFIFLYASAPAIYAQQRVRTGTTKPVVSLCLPGGISGGIAGFTNYNTEQGLALSSVKCSFMDRLGNLWFGTLGGGVSRYDGKSFTTFTTAQGLANNQVFGITEDKSGTIWFATYGGGVSRYDGKSFTNYTTKEGLANNLVYCVALDSTGNLWFGTDGGGVSRYDGKKFTNYTSAQGLGSNQVYCIAVGKAGNVWLGTLGGGVSRYKELSFSTFNTKNGLANNAVLSICEDKDGMLWFGGSGGSLSRFDEGRASGGGSGQHAGRPSSQHAGRFVNFTSAKGLGTNTILCIMKDHAGNLWFGMMGGGLSEAVQDSYINFTTAHGLPNNQVMCITEDKTGNLWMGTYGGGISRYDGNAFTSFTSAQGLANSQILGIQEDHSGNLWFGTSEGGVIRYDGNRFTTFTITQGLADNRVMSIQEDKTGNLWFGTLGGGVSKYDRSSFTTYTTAQGLANNNVLCMMEDKSGHLWFGTDGGGLSQYDGRQFSNFSSTLGLANNVVNSICEDNTGNLWFGTAGGLSRYGKGRFTNFTINQGLASNRINSIQKDRKGNLWIGTDEGGVSFLSSEKVEHLAKMIDTINVKTFEKNFLFENYTSKQGLSDDVVYGIVEDKQGRIIIGTNLGFTVLRNGHKAGEKFGEGAEWFNNKTGYPVKDMNTNSMICDSRGIIWAGTGDKLVRFDYSGIHRNPEPPTCVIQELKINERTVSWYTLQNRKFYSGQKPDSAMIAQQEVLSLGHVLNQAERENLVLPFEGLRFDAISRFYPLPQNLVLPYELNNVEFEFAAIEPAKPFLVNYQYKLEGYGKDWSPVLKNTSATFGNLQEGVYTFILKAESPDGIWCEPVTYSFRVLPPWYRTWWMYIIYLVAACIFGWSFFRWRTAALRKEKEVLEQTVMERTADVVKEKEEAERQKDIAETQKYIIQEKQKEILDSIHYAKRIQDALLKQEELVGAQLPSHFILFKPKDIVSGDFYWGLEKKAPVGSAESTEEYWYLAAADCTGHGVPGAFLTMLGTSFLNEISAVPELLSPATILDQLRARIIKELGQTGKAGESKDGMDISLLRVRKSEPIELQWAGANNPIYILHGQTLTEIKPDKQPIGYADQLKPFTNHSVQVQKGDTVYIFSDGFADQFGGPSDKKFMSKRMKNTLISISALSMPEQKLKLNEVFENWKGNFEQIDDVCVIGLRI